jgi:branched-chain amino acid transport system permease protein
MQQFAQQVVSGIASGAIYASLALALALVYRASGVVNFAQGEMAMFSTYVALAFINHGLSYWAAFFAAIGVALAGGIVVERAAIRRLADELGYTTSTVSQQLAVLARDQVDALLHGREHPEPEQVDLEKAGIRAGVLVPLNELPPGHRGRHHRHELDQRAAGDNHPARVLRGIARQATDLAAELTERAPAR